MNEFDRLIDHIPGDKERWRMATIEVADTAYLCLRWFETQKLKATAADVIAMTKLVLDRETANQREEEAE